MNIEVLEYSASYSDLWDDFISKANNSTIFHDLKFFDYHPAGRFDNRHLIFKHGNKVLAVLTGAIRTTDSGEPIYVSHAGASYGGFALPMDSGIREAHDLLDSLLGYLSINGIHKLRITPPPLFYMKLPHQHIEFALMKANARVLKSELTSVVHLGRSIDENFALFRPTARTATRKAEKSGVTVSFNDKWDEFYSLLERNLGMRHNVKPTHTLDELLKLRDLFPDKILLISSFLDGVMLAGVTVFITNPQSLLAFYISHINEYQQARPLNLLFYKLFEWGIEGGYSVLDFGTFTLNMVPNFGLGNFKEGFGAGGIFRTTWELDF